LPNHPPRAMPTHPSDQQPVSMDGSSASSDPVTLPYVLLGAVAAAERRTRGVISTGERLAGAAARPARWMWRSPVGAPIRRVTADAATDLAGGGRDLALRARSRVGDTGTEVIGGVSDQVFRSRLVDEVVDRLLSDGAFDRVITVIINHPATEVLVTRTLDDPALDRLVDLIMESRLVDEITARLLESDEMRMVLDYVTRSPELRAALRRQTTGLAEDVASGVRSRTVSGDALAERVARRLLGRQ